MSYTKNELRERIFSLFTQDEIGMVGLSNREVSELIGKESKDTNQVLKGLADAGRLSRKKIKRGVDPKVFVYFSPSFEVIDEAPERLCNNCQRLSGLEKCILLRLVKETAAWALRDDLKARANAISLLGVEGCDFHDPRQKGQCKCKTMKDFLNTNTDPVTFEVRCPIDRCREVIDELSISLEKKNIGANTLYCPHCGSPINFTFNHSLGRYNVQYYDSRFDIMQRDYKLITGMDLESRYVSDRSHGFSLVKEESFHLDLENNETIYIGNELTPTEFIDSKDLAYFSLNQLDYIAVKDADDYLYLRDKLHEIDPATNKSLYYNIELLHSSKPIESTEPSLKEIGGNEILIATGAIFFPMFFSNILDRRAVLKKKMVDMTDTEFRSDFKSALARFDRNIKKYRTPWNISSREWQQNEGGFASLMDTPFKQEAEKYGFENLSREKSRMVRGEPFMHYGLFTARAPKASFENGVNKVTDRYIKEKIYNDLSVPWNDLRGWCHRKYSFGLFLDYIEPPRAVAPLWINEAIRNKEITPNDFKIERGKRFEKFYYIKPNSHAHEVVKRVSNQILCTRFTLTTGSELTMKQMIEKSVTQLKQLLNRLSNSTVELFTENRINGPVKTIWKKLQETNNKNYLTAKEYQMLQKHVQHFFREEFSFEPYTIAEIQ